MGFWHEVDLSVSSPQGHILKPSSETQKNTRNLVFISFKARVEFYRILTFTTKKLAQEMCGNMQHCNT